MSFPNSFVQDFHESSVVAQMPYRELGNTGVQVSALSFGASSLGSVFRNTNNSESLAVVKAAIKSGINYIDTAPWYGQGKSEQILGQVLPLLPRKSYYIATKVGRYEKETVKMFDFSAERTLNSVDESLSRLGLSYVDMIQVHDMEFAPSLDVVINETLPALQKIKDSGKAKFIGITGYPLENFRTVLEQSKVPIDIILSYCRASMNDTSLLEELPYYQEKGVGVVNASPISMGLLSSRGPPDWHPAHDFIKRSCSNAAQYCKEHGTDISKLALRFTLDQKQIPTTLVSTASLENLKKNLKTVHTPLSNQEREVLDEVMDKFMKPLKNAHWEGKEVNQYKSQLEKLAENKQLIK